MIIAQNLRDDATAIRNQKKIKEIIHQRPKINPKYCFKVVCHLAEPQSDTLIISSLVDKVRTAKLWKTDCNKQISLNYIKQLRLKDDVPLALHQTL